MKKQFDIETLLEQEDISVNDLAENYGYRIINSGNVTRLNSAPEKIYFGGELFFVSLIFEHKKLVRVVMMPYIEGVDSPNYPDENYQLLKINHCKKVLCELYGSEGTLIENGMQWENSQYTIGCYGINEGKDKYTGGNIIISMR